MAARKPRVTVSGSASGKRKPRVNVSASVSSGSRRRRSVTTPRARAGVSISTSSGKGIVLLILICLGILGGAYFLERGNVGFSLGFDRVRIYLSKPFKSGQKSSGTAKEFVPYEFKAVVISVYDGDTITVIDAEDEKHKIRLWGIDAPEMDQPYGLESQKYLQKLIDAKEVEVMVRDVDKYSRLIAVIYVGDTMINGEMVESGHAWWYEHFAPAAQDLANYQAEAQKYRRGLWRKTHPVPPWYFRQGKR